MKKFINEHPKLYWMIVGVLAVIVFSVVTAVGCAKLERAEASETSNGVYYPDLLNEIELGDLRMQIEELVANHQYIIVNNEYGIYKYAFLNSVVDCGKISSPDGYVLNSSNFDYVEYNPSANTVAVKNRSFGDNFRIITNSTINVIGSNFDYRTGWSALSGMPYNNISYPVLVPPMQYTYLVNAPYAVIDDFDDYNEHLNTNFTKLENDEITVEFSLGGQPMSPEHGYLLDYTLYVWLPSKLYINNHYGDFSEQYFATQCGKNKDEFTADMKTWRYGVGTNSDSVLYKLPLKYEFYNNPETGESGEYRIQLDYKDIIDYLETAYGDGENDFSFEDYYDNENFTGYLWDFVLSHMVVSRMDALVYTQIDDVDTYYGRTTTFTFLRNGNFVYSEVNKDALNEDISSDMTDGINNALQEGLIQSGDKVDELQQNINNVSGSLGSFDTEFEGVDLWNGIKGFGSGLVGLTGFLGNIATVLGSVFVFMPYDVRQLVGYFFMASLVVALWKLIKR